LLRRVFSITTEGRQSWLNQYDTGQPVSFGGAKSAEQSAVPWHYLDQQAISTSAMRKQEARAPSTSHTCSTREGFLSTAILETGPPLNSMLFGLWTGDFRYASHTVQLILVIKSR